MSLRDTSYFLAAVKYFTKKGNDNMLNLLCMSKRCMDDTMTILCKLFSYSYFKNVFEFLVNLEIFMEALNGNLLKSLT